MNSRCQPLAPQLDAENPWPGLYPYEESARTYFFGREVETDVLFRMVRRETMVIFYGQSGLGKTSLLQAGLFPKLREEGFLPVMVRLDYDPTAPSLASQVKRAIGEVLRSAGIDARPPNETESLWEYFHRTDVDFWDAQNRRVTLVLAFDQFEERFTLGRHSPEADHQANAFLTELEQLVENRLPPSLRDAPEPGSAAKASFDFDKRFFRIILSLREDFLPEIDGLRTRFSVTLDHSLRLKPMNEAQAQAVISGPQPTLVTDAVASEIVRFVSGSERQPRANCTVEPVLLSVVLFELNHRRRRNGQTQITSDLLVGSRDQILEGFYEEALSGLRPEARLLVEEGLLTSANRRDSIAWENALSQYRVDENTLGILIDRHLLRREERTEGARLELVHDRLAEVVQARREARHEQERQAKDIHLARSREEELLRQREAQRQRVQRLVWLCFILALFGLSMAALGLYAWKKKKEVEAYSVITQQQSIAVTRQTKELANANKNLQQKTNELAGLNTILEQTNRQLEQKTNELAGLNTMLEQANKKLEQNNNELARLNGRLEQANHELTASKERAQIAQLDAEKLMKFVLFELTDKLRPIGRADVLHSIAKEVSDFKSQPNTQDLVSRLQVFKVLGQAQILQGNSTDAMAAFTKALAIAEELKVIHKGDTNWQCQVLLCHQYIGEICEAQGKTGQALDEYRASLTIARDLANIQTNVIEWQRLCLWHHVKIGDVLWLQGNRREARLNHKAAVEIGLLLDGHYARSSTNLPPPDFATRLLLLDAIAIAWQRDLLVSHNPSESWLLQKLGWAQAYQRCTENLAAAQKLMDTNNSSQLRSYLALCHGNLGDLLFLRNRLDEARTHYMNSRDIRQQLYEEDSANTQRGYDLLGSYVKLDRVITAQNQKSKAAAIFNALWSAPIMSFWHVNKLYYKKVVDIYRIEQVPGFNLDFSKTTNLVQQLVNRDLQNPVWQGALAQSHTLLGDSLRRAGRREEAAWEYQKALNIRQKLAMWDTNALETQLLLALSHGKLAAALQRLSKHDQSLFHARSSLETFVTLFGRWPGNFLFMEGPHAGEKNVGYKVPLSQDQVQDIESVFTKGFARARKLADHRSATPKEVEDWAVFCSEIAVSKTLFDDVEQSVSYAKNAVDAWQRLTQMVPTDKDYQHGLARACLALAAYQIFNHQPQEAIRTSLRGLALNDSRVEFEAMLSLGYLIEGQHEEANAIFKQNIHLQLAPAQTFQTIVSNDFRQLQDKGIIPQNTEGVDK